MSNARFREATLQWADGIRRALLAGESIGDPRGGSWPSGALGLSLFFSRLYELTHASKWRDAAIRGVLRAFDAAPLRVVNGLYGAPVGSAAAVSLLASTHPSLGSLRVRLGREAADFIYMQRPNFDRLRTSDFDLISGVSGYLVYLRTRSAVEAAVPMDHWWDYVLAMGQRVVPFGFTAQEQDEDFFARNESAKIKTIGVAHGIAGLAGALSRHVSEKPEVEPLVRSLVGRAENYYLNECCDTRREGWCFGMVGATATIAPALRRYGRLKYWLAALGRSLSQFDLAWPSTPDGVSLCHGIAGVARGLRAIVEFPECTQVLRFAYRKLMSRAQVQFTETAQAYPSIADACFLTGLTGAAMALLAPSRSCGPRWEWLFLM